MAQPKMMTASTQILPRRWGRLLLLLALSFLAWFGWRIHRVGLGPSDAVTGLALLVLLVVLALFNSRKRLPGLPLLRASTWLQFHIYVGFFAVILFLLHIDFQIPRGLLEVVLAGVFTIVALSGVLGLILSKALPRMMTRAGEPIIHERVPDHRRAIQERARAVVLRAETECASSTLPEFHEAHLADFLESKPSLLHPFGSERKRTSHLLLGELKARYRFLSPEEKELALLLENCVTDKESIDFQDASQRLLKGWLFLHIPFSLSLLLLGVVHGVLALLYGSHG